MARDLFGPGKTFIGVIHLPPLPGSPRWGGDLGKVLDRARQVTAFDFSPRMLRLAEERTRSYAQTGRLRLLAADAMAMPFSDNTFDCATMGFGLRNLEDPAVCIREFLRVLRPGGRLVILDISRPAGGFQLMVYRPVFRALLPLIGRLFSGDRHAYRYLARSVDDFLSPPELTQAITAAGFVDVTYRLLHLDTITIHLGIKPG